MKNFQKIDKEEYGKLLNKVESKTFFHGLKWHEFLEKQFKWLKFEYYLYKDEAVLAFGQTGKKKISLPFCEYGGPLPLKTDFNLEEFERDTLKEFGNDVKIKIYPFTGIGKNSDMCTHWIENLNNKSENEIWDSLRKTLRHEIKNAQEQGLEIRASKDPKEIRKFYELYVANLRRKRTVPYPWQIVQFLCQNPSNELLLAFYKGKIVGGALFLRYERMSHYFFSATDHKYRNLSITHLIIWEKVKHLIGKDIVLDLGASPKGSKLEVFKSGWSNTEYPIYQIGIKRNEENLRSSKLIRFVWGLLPNFVVRKLSPWLIKYRL
jgi:hypothetical protein